MKPTTARPVSSLGSLWLPMLLCLDTLLIKLQVNCDSAVQSSSRTQALPNQLDSTQLQEPLVWNSNSLYDSSLASASYQSSGHTKRVRRSPTGSEQVHPALPALVDACQSKLEVITPLYATNAKGKLRTVVNSELMQQAIQVETCLRPTGNHQAKCNTQPECGCEQKYKWHRLLVLDADKDRKPSQSALFMDWFLFPSACVCRCRAGNFSGKQFLKTVHQPGRTQQTPRDLRTNPAQSQLRLGP